MENKTEEEKSRRQAKGKGGGGEEVENEIRSTFLLAGLRFSGYDTHPYSHLSLSSVHSSISSTVNNNMDQF